MGEYRARQVAKDFELVRAVAQQAIPALDADPRQPILIFAVDGEDGAFRPAAELRQMYESAGITPDKEVISYCQGGYRAAHSYLALRLLGYPRVRNYIGSWKEWGDREDLPIETPSQP